MRCLILNNINTSKDCKKNFDSNLHKVLLTGGTHFLRWSVHGCMCTRAVSTYISFIKNQLLRLQYACNLYQNAHFFAIFGILHQTLNQWVVGSSPTGSTEYKISRSVQSVRLFLLTYFAIARPRRTSATTEQYFCGRERHTKKKQLVIDFFSVMTEAM